MKIRFILFLVVVFSCKNRNTSSKYAGNDKVVETIVARKSKTFFVGDVNNDKINDTAYINLKLNGSADEIGCDEKNCYINVEFNGNIPKISLNQSLGVFISKTEDLNNDNANEILIFSRTNEGWWDDVSVWSFKNKSWTIIAITKAFISEDQDFENRIIKENGSYYLIGQNPWEEDENGDFKKISVKI